MVTVAFDLTPIAASPTALTSNTVNVLFVSNSLSFRIGTTTVLFVSFGAKATVWITPV